MKALNMHILLAIAVIMIFTVGTKVNAAIIGVDARNAMSAHNILYDGFAFQSFRDIFTSEGHTLVPLNNFLADDFVGLDAAIITTRSGGWTTEESDAIENFVLGGGGLLFSSDGAGSAEVVNIFSDRFGITYSGARTDSSGLTVTGFNNHSITEGINTLGVDYQRAVSGFSGQALDLTIGGGTQNILGVNGKAVFLSDMSMFSTYTSDRSLSFGDNAKLVGNIAEYITIPEPASASLLAVVGGFTFFLRKRLKR